MKKILTIALGLTIGLGMTSCNRKGCTDELASNYNEKSKKDDGTCVYEAQTITLKMTQSFNDVNVTSADMNDIKFTNAYGTKLSLTKLQYHISDFRLYLEDGDSIMFDDYYFVDITDDATLTQEVTDFSEMIEGTSYNGRISGVGFNYGFDEEDNVSGAYADLNAASWAWPDMIGGGYHQLKMEGRYINTDGDTISYQYHNGSATVNGSGESEVNYRFVKLSGSSFDLSGPTTIEINMNLENWYQNPNLWNLNDYYTMLMPNYTAQIMMTENSVDVFTVGTISQ